MNIISLQNVNKTYRIRGNRNLITGLFDPRWRYVDAIKDISFDVKKGESVAFLGPNGAGKTTTTKMMSGLMHPSGGKISVLGFNPFERNHTMLKKIGLVMGQKNILNWDLSANQSFWLLENIYELETKPTKDRINKLSKLLNVQSFLDTPIRQLSLGQRMKVELIAAMLHKPEILFLDEPTIGLDIPSRSAIRDFIKFTNQEEGTTILLTSHDMADIEDTCSRSIIINNGVVVYDDQLAKLKKSYSKVKYLTVTYHAKTSDRHDLKGMKLIRNLSDYQVQYEVDSAKSKSIIAALLDSDIVDDISLEAVSLEKIISDKF